MSAFASLLRFATVPNLRFGPEPIRAPYLIAQAGFVGCHHIGFLERVNVLGRAAPGATLLLTCPYPAPDVWAQLSRQDSCATPP